MKAPRPLHGAAALAARRPAHVLAITAVLAIVATALAVKLKPDAGTDTLVGKGTDAYAATTTYRERFGDDPIIVLVRGSLTKLLLSQDLERLIGLEGCISGNVPAGATPPGGASGPCGRLQATAPVRVVFGPGTFIGEAARQLGGGFVRRLRQTQARARSAAARARKDARRRELSRAQAARRAAQARQAVLGDFQRTAIELAARYGLTSIPRIDDPNFVSTLVFDASKPPGTPKRKFAYLFPTKGKRAGTTALVQVRLKAGLGDAQRAEAIRLIRAAVAMPEWKPRNGAAYAVTGAPVVVADLADAITDSMKLLLVAALLVMAGTLALVFRSRLRLLALGIALVASALTFGAAKLSGASLTMASVAVLPVLIGLAVDYAIQLQSRISEEQGQRDGEAEERLGAAAAARRAALLGAPAVAAAAAATAAGFAALALSPVPMVRDFGLLLVAGIAIAFACALIAGTAAIVLADVASLPRPLARLGAGLAPSLRGARELITDNRLARAAGPRVRLAGAASLRFAIGQPGRVLAIAAAVAVAGWALDTQTRVESDIARLVPGDLPGLRDLNALQRATGVGASVDVVIEADDLTRPEVLAWMIDYQTAILKRFGYSAQRGCGQAVLCPAFSLPALLRTESSRSSAAGIRELLDAVPAYFSQSVITSDRRTATLAFGLRLMALDRQKRVVDAMRTELDDGRPAGVRARLAGLPVLASEANAQVSSSARRFLTLLAGLLAVALVLLAALRSASRALIPLVPIALATGWSAFVLFALRIPLNPMSVTLGALVIAISTEFSVLLAERYRQERRRGHEPATALVRTYRSTGAAVLASGVTAIAGFAVLVVSDIRMLRDFGFVTVIDLTVSLLGVLVVLPAVLLLQERYALRRRRSAAPRPRAMA
ncbi:MAG: MMPL family transporter [Actinomycetota bacterium]|nr:MMPL family transporter [Actinomycetota bacterium]